jgi:cell division protein FtsB
MTLSDHELTSLADRSEQRERQARKRAWLFSLIPIFFAGLLLGYTIWQIQMSARELASVEAKLSDTNAKYESVSQKLTTLETQMSEVQAQLDATTSKLDAATAQLANAQSELDAANTLLDQTRTELVDTKNELTTTKNELADAKSDLESARIFVQHAIQIDPMAFKNFESQNTPQAKLLLYILDLQRNNAVRWNPAGASLAEGFDSPNFATYVLEKFNLLPTTYQPGSKPWGYLKQTERLANGDIVYYTSGYTMFYFELPSYQGSEAQRFVIGMTPLGIITQEMDFADKSGFLHVPYR